MPGFFAANCNDKEKIKLVNYCESNCLKGEMVCGELTIKRNILNSFINDKLFFENEEIAVATDGIILNSNKLLEKYEKNTLTELVELLAITNKNFFSEFEGTFSGCVYYKCENKIVAFTGPLGDHAVFYFYNEQLNCFALGSQLNYVVDYLEKIGIKMNEDLHGISCFIDYGYFIDDSTGIKEVKRIYPGDYIEIDLNNKKIEVNSYYKINVKEKDVPLDEAIENIDIAFCNAISRLANKNREYGYKNLLDLSGGMDSRAICYTAKRLGYEDTFMITYSQSNSNEEKIAKKIATNLGFDWYYKILDNGKCVTQIEDLMFMNSGTAYYIGITGGKDFLEILNNHKVGIEFTGLLGDVKENTMTLEDGENPPSLLNPRYRTSKLRQLNKNTYSNRINEFKTHEIFWFYTRGMLAGMSTFLTRQNFVEPATPFGDKEFIETFFSIPWKQRTENNILLLWMEKKYPEAIRIPYAATGISVKNDSAWYNVFKRRTKYYSKKILCKINKKPVVNDMNPVDYWLSNKEELVVFINDYYENNFNNIKASIEIKKRIEDLFVNASCFNDKMIALSAIAYYKLYLR